MKDNLALKQILKWVVIPLSFCGLGYFVIGPSLGKDLSIKHTEQPLYQKTTSKSHTSMSVKDSLKADESTLNKDNIEFTVEDITIPIEPSIKESISNNFPQSNPKKPRKKVTVAPQSPVTVVEEPSPSTQDSESEL